MRVRNASGGGAVQGVWSRATYRWLAFAPLFALLAGCHEDGHDFETTEGTIINIALAIADLVILIINAFD